MTPDHKPLSAAEIGDLVELRGMAVSPEHMEFPDETTAKFYSVVVAALPRLLAMLQPPTDAAVREAVELLGGVYPGMRLCTNGVQQINTLLSHARAVQSPRLTSEQVEAVRGMDQITRVVLNSLARDAEKNGGGVREELRVELHERFGALVDAFPGVFGQEG